MRRKAFSRTVQVPGAPFHVAAHSHHPWPDVSFEAQMQCWTDAAALLDRKWGYILGTVKPAACAHVARILNLKDPATISFAPNTHVILCALMSCLDWRGPVRVLTTDSEFHSLTRQLARLEEETLVAVTRVPTRPFESFAERFGAEAAKGGHDMIYLSHVFFNSGYALSDNDLKTIADTVPHPDTFVVIDGYHSFMARPVDFSALQDRAFYLSGGYKYAMAGEGVCFLHAPPGYGPRPRITGWYAAFAALSAPQDGAVGYAQDAARFDGATFDPSGLYRFNGVMDWLSAEGLTVEAMDRHVRDLQRRFLELLGPGVGPLRVDRLLVDPHSGRAGRFLTFETPQAGALHDALAERNVITDYRGDRLRLGFGIYHEAEDMARLMHHLEAVCNG